MIYHLRSIFSSLQGEGRNSGRPCVFIRFSSCNLSCPWCDTHKTERMQLTEQDILAEVAEHKVRSVIITGGEPSIQPGLDLLVTLLKKSKYWVGLETNGIVAPEHPELFDYISVSPKVEFLSKYLDKTMLKRANEVRIVATKDDVEHQCMNLRKRIIADDYYISPLEKDDKIHYRRALTLLTKLNKLNTEPQPWSLSIQMHKVLGIR